MRYLSLFMIVSFILIGCRPSGPGESLLEARQAHQTQLTRQEALHEPVPPPVGDLSTGGTMALLAAASSDRFRAVFSLGPISNPKYYGQDVLTFDTGDEFECLLRSPIEWLNTIKTPTYVFEGTDGNIDSLIAMHQSSKNASLQFYSIGKHTHFSCIRLVSQQIVEQILADTTPEPAITFDSGEPFSPLTL